MRALTIWQPWASLVACGAKTYETHAWPTDYRGPVAIYAGAEGAQGFFCMLHPEIQSTMLEALYPLYAGWHNLPYGCIIATAELAECWHIVRHPGTNVSKADKIPIGAEITIPKGYVGNGRHPHQSGHIVPSKSEMLFGDWTPGRYAWEFRNVKMLPKPVPAKGRQRFWEWEEEGMPV